MNKYRIVAERTSSGVKDISSTVKVYKGACSIPLDEGVGRHLSESFGYQARAQLEASGRSEFAIEVRTH